MLISFMRGIVLFVLLMLAGHSYANATHRTNPLEREVIPRSYNSELTIIPGQAAFRATLQICLDIRQATDSIVLDATGLVIDHLKLVVGGRAVNVSVESSEPEKIRVRAARRLVPGRALLQVEYRGTISRSANAGLFEIHKDNDSYVFAQLQPMYARRVFPCFDEPGFRARWTIALNVPRTAIGISNAPLVRMWGLPNNLKHLAFATTAPLPPYAVSVAVGHFNIAKADAVTMNRIPIRIVSPSGFAKHSDWIATLLSTVLSTTATYLRVSYPYQKLDVVMLPSGSIAASTAGVLLISEAMIPPSRPSDVAGRYDAVSLLAHEIAHQWFGNQVAPVAWEDSWLDEGLAQFVRSKVLQILEPTALVASKLLEARLSALAADQVVAERIRRPLMSSAEVAVASETAVQKKTVAILYMLENYTGAASFRSALTRFLRKHRNTDVSTRDFLTILAVERGGPSLAEVLKSYLDNAGSPTIVLHVSCGGSMPQVHVTQVSQRATTGQQTPLLWHIPVCLRYPSPEGDKRQCAILVSHDSDIPLRHAQSCPAWVLANDSSTGYYRVQYEDRHLLLDLLTDKRARLSSADVVELIGDTTALASAAIVPADVVLTAIAALRGDSRPEIIVPITKFLRTLADGPLPPNLYPHYIRFVRWMFSDQARSVGWYPKVAEAPDVSMLRKAVLDAAGRLGRDEPIISDARHLATMWLAGDRSINPDLTSLALVIAAENGNASFFRQLTHALDSDHVPRERAAVLKALGAFRDTSVAREALQLIFDKRIDSRESFFFLFFGPLANPETRTLPLTFAEGHLVPLLRRLPDDAGISMAAYLPYAGAEGCSAEARERLQSLFDTHLANIAGAEQQFQRAMRQITLCEQMRALMGASLEQFLERF
jgi:cytosol alanyl aminopeptidase